MGCRLFVNVDLFGLRKKNFQLGENRKNSREEAQEAQNEEVIQLRAARFSFTRRVALSASEDFQQLSVDVLFVSLCGVLRTSITKTNRRSRILLQRRPAPRRSGDRRYNGSHSILKINLGIPWNQQRTLCRYLVIGHWSLGQN